MVNNIITLCTSWHGSTICWSFKTSLISSFLVQSFGCTATCYDFLPVDILNTIHPRRKFHKQRKHLMNAEMFARSHLSTQCRQRSEFPSLTASRLVSTQIFGNVTGEINFHLFNILNAARWRRSYIFPMPWMYSKAERSVIHFACCPQRSLARFFFLN